MWSTISSLAATASDEPGEPSAASSWVGLANSLAQRSREAIQETVGPVVGEIRDALNESDVDEPAGGEAGEVDADRGGGDADAAPPALSGLAQLAQRSQEALRGALVGNAASRTDSEEDSGSDQSGEEGHLHSHSHGDHEGRHHRDHDQDHHHLHRHHDKAVSRVSHDADSLSLAGMLDQVRKERDALAVKLDEVEAHLGEARTRLELQRLTMGDELQSHEHAMATLHDSRQLLVEQVRSLEAEAVQSKAREAAATREATSSLQGRVTELERQLGEAKTVARENEARFRAQVAQLQAKLDEKPSPSAAAAPAPSPSQPPKRRSKAAAAAAAIAAVSTPTAGGGAAEDQVLSEQLAKAERDALEAKALLEAKVLELEEALSKTKDAAAQRELELCKSQLHESPDELNRLRAAEQHLVHELNSSKAALVEHSASSTAALAEKQKQLDETTARLGEATSKLERLEREALTKVGEDAEETQLLEERLAEAQARLNNIRAELKTTLESESHARTAWEAGNRALAETQVALEEALKREVALAGQEQKTLEELAGKQQALNASEGRVAELEKQVQTLKYAAEKHAAERGQSSDELDQARAALAAVQTELRKERDARGELEKRMASESERTLLVAEQAAAMKRAQEAQAEDLASRLRALDSERADLQAREIRAKQAESDAEEARRSQQAMGEYVADLRKEVTRMQAQVETSAKAQAQLALERAAAEESRLRAEAALMSAQNELTAALAHSADALQVPQLRAEAEAARAETEALLRQVEQGNAAARRADELDSVVQAVRADLARLSETDAEVRSELERMRGALARTTHEQERAETAHRSKVASLKQEIASLREEMASRAAAASARDAEHIEEIRRLRQELAHQPPPPPSPTSSSLSSTGAAGASSSSSSNDPNAVDKRIVNQLVLAFVKRGKQRGDPARREVVETMARILGWSDELKNEALGETVPVSTKGVVKRGLELFLNTAQVNMNLSLDDAARTLEEKSFEDVVGEFLRDGEVKAPRRSPQVSASPMSSTSKPPPPQQQQQQLSVQPVPFVIPENDSETSSKASAPVESTAAKASVMPGTKQTSSSEGLLLTEGEDAAMVVP